MENPCNPAPLFPFRYSHGQRRIYTISALIHVKASTSAGLIFTRQSDGSSLTSVKTGIGTFTKKVADTASYSVCGILELPGDQTLSLYIHLGTREKFQILKGSRISVTTTDQVYQAFHVTLRNPVIFLFILNQRNCLFSGTVIRPN